MVDISVVIPVFNTEDDLPKCIESVIEQNFESLEIIIVNDGSTDGSHRIIKHYLGIDNRIVYLKQNNKGLGCARNNGFLKASGKYLLFVDSDDWLEKDSLTILFEKAEMHKAEIVVFNYTIDYGSGLRQIRCLHKHSSLMKGEDYLLKAMGEGNFSPTVCNKFIKRSNVTGLRFPENVIHEDIYYSTVLLISVQKVLTLDKAFYVYNKNREKAITSQISEKNVIDILAVYEATVNSLEKMNKSQILQNRIFKNDFIERINLEILIKLIDNTQKHNTHYVIALLKKNTFFKKMSLHYILHGRSVKHRIFILLFYFNQHLFLTIGKGLYTFLYALKVIKW